MDPRPDVTGVRPHADAVVAEQAVFTSIRSPWGRAIAHRQPRDQPEEKAEIVQRAPSHQSICDASAHGCGLASFAMQSGRRCIFCAQNAGVEHSAAATTASTPRVDPHAADYCRLRCDPWHLDRRARRPRWQVAERGATVALAQLDRRARRDRVPAAPATWSPSTDDLDRLLSVLSHLLGGCRVLVQGPLDALGVLAWIWSGVPAALRAALSLSCGLRYSPGRSFPLILLEGPCSEAERSGNGAEFTVVDWAAATRPEASEFDPWLSLVRRHWAAGRLAELNPISAELTEACTAPVLARVAGLCADHARLADADLESIDELTARHARSAWTNGTGARLYAEFCHAAAGRREQLQQQAEDAGAAAQDSCAGIR
jgi:hypothetical protein